MSEINFFLIDLDRLEQHWQEQPELMRMWGEKYARTRLAYEQAVAELDRMYAELDRKVRENPDKYFNGKATEKAIENIIRLDAVYRKKQDEVIQLRGKVEQLKAIVQALEHRRTALENLVKLHGQQYFALPESKVIDLREVTKKSVRGRIAERLKDKK